MPTPIVVVGTPEFKIADRALSIAGKNPKFVVSYLEWAGAFGYASTKPGSVSMKPSTALMKTGRAGLRDRFAKLNGWNGQCFYVGHSQGATNLFIGGYTPFTKNPNFSARVPGQEYGQFLVDVLPNAPSTGLHLPIFACWLGDPKDSGAMGFQRALLTTVSRRFKSAYTYATKFETWYGSAEFVSVNGIRRDGFSGDEEGQALLKRLRAEWEKDPEAMRGKFNEYVDDEFRVASDARGKPARDHTAEFTSLADILKKDYLSAKHAAEGTQKKVFTTFFLRDGRLARDKKNEVGSGKPGNVELV